jgi:hypothetical protein
MSRRAKLRVCRSPAFAVLAETGGMVLHKAACVVKPLRDGAAVVVYTNMETDR